MIHNFSLQYFLPFAAEGINKHIEEAILRADRLGVKVISLAALNKVCSSVITSTMIPHTQTHRKNGFMSYAIN